MHYGIADFFFGQVTRDLETFHERSLGAPTYLEQFLNVELLPLPIPPLYTRSEYVENVADTLHVVHNVPPM